MKRLLFKAIGSVAAATCVFNMASGKDLSYVLDAATDGVHTQIQAMNFQGGGMSGPRMGGNGGAPAQGGQPGGQAPGQGAGSAPGQSIQQGSQAGGPAVGQQAQGAGNNGFGGGGSFDGHMPEVQGNTDNPNPDTDMIHEIAQQEGLTESEDYSYVYTLGEVNESEYEAFTSYLEESYDDCASILSSFESDGWEIILTSADLDQLLYNGSTQGVAGCTVFNSKTIYVETGDYEYCVIHELGHYLDYKYGFASQKGEFSSIYASEGNLLTDYGSTDATEFFAEVFMYGILDESSTASTVSAAYNYVESLKAAF